MIRLYFFGMPKRPSQHELINIYKDTLEYAREILDELPNSFKYKMNEEDVLGKYPKPYETTNVRVEDCDVIESIIRLNRESPSNKDNKMLVLNLASEKSFGGGVHNGAMAQEEELFRKTTYGVHQGKTLYPLEDDEFVFTPCIYVIKDTKYNRISTDSADMVPFDGLAIAGVRHPNLVEGHLAPEDYQLMKQKIECIFKFALVNQNTNLVLGALGCGVFFNPPEDIADIYKYCLEKYNGYFKNIVFAVLSNKTKNFDVFNYKICNVASTVKKIE